MKMSDYIYHNFSESLKNIREVSEELRTKLTNEMFVQELFEVCKKVSHIGINAPKFKVPNSTNVQASFQYNDIDNAISCIIGFAHRYPDIEYAELLGIIESVHRYAHTEDDARKMYGGVMIDNSPIAFGSFHNFAELPKNVWNNFSNYTVECICRGISPDSANSALFSD